MEQKQYLALKQEAKELLLKGCYKMAINKYKHLIANHPLDLKPRQLSILYLNQGICHQFLSNLEKSLEFINIAIKTDPSYQKSYYRKIQICKQLKKFQEILSMPQFVRNKQIDQLMVQVKQEYSKYLEQGQIDLIEKELKKSIEQNDQKRIVQLNRVLAKRYCESKNLQKQLHEGIFKRFFQMIKESGKQRMYKLYYDLVYAVTKDNSSVYLTQNWWVSNINYILLHDCVQTLNKIMRLCPYFNIFGKDKQARLSTFLKSIKQQNLKDSLQNLLILLNKEKTTVNLSQFQETESLINFLCNVIYKILEQQNKLQFEFVWSILSIILQSNSKNNAQQKNFVVKSFEDLCFVLFNISQQYQQANSEFIELQTSKVEKLVSHVLSQSFNIPSIYLLNDILMRSKFKNQNFPSNFKQNLQKFRKQGNQTSQLIMLLITIKVDPLSITLKQAEQILNKNYQDQNLFLELVSSLCVINRQYLLLMMKSSKLLIQILTNIHKNNAQFKKLRSRGAVISLLYLICVDISQNKNIQAANKLGVTVQEIVGAKKLQTSKQQTATEEQIKEKRTMLLNIKIQLFKNVVECFLESSTKLISFKLCSILSSLSKINNKLFYSTHIVEFMIEEYKNAYSQKEIFSFFASITKQCNSQMFLFKHKQLVVNILSDGLQKSGHQLIIFESLLGIINLQSDTQIDIKKIFKLLFEENEYIIHACMNIINNYLVKGQSYFDKLSDKDIQMIMMFKRHYQSLQKQSSPQGSNHYSHPHRIYATILSLLMVISSYKQFDIKELETFSNLVQSCKHIDIRWRAEVIGKGMMYFSNKGQLDKNTIQKAKQQLQYIKVTNQGFYSQLGRLI